MEKRPFKRQLNITWRCAKLYIFLVGSICFLIACFFWILTVSHDSIISTPTRDRKNKSLLHLLHLLAIFTSFHSKDSEKSDSRKDIFFRNHSTFNFKGSFTKREELKGNTNKPPFSGKPTHEDYIHLRPYHFLINESNKCLKRTPYLVFLIATRVDEYERREAIRTTWGSEMVLSGTDVVRLFMLGMTTTEQSDAILKESRLYHDIIQQDFLDTYRNLTLKTLMGLTWVANYCSKANFVMKTDSDVFVNTQYLIQNLLQTIATNQQEYFTGSIMTGFQPHRNKESKWYMPKEVYPEDNYPSFCSGTGYVFSAALASKIFDASRTVPYVHLEDIYIALCLKKAGIQLTPPPKRALFNIHRIPFSACAYNSLITSHEISPSELLSFWQEMQDGKHTCLNKIQAPEQSSVASSKQRNSTHTVDRQTSFVSFA
ncbi:beta-1,3-galactosyltransferase 1-like [Tiliqua scincoides]|uniref:beta-1,3-galactosyltransferase 1-like n=1 Tax=Tiliqua scincoides TaxID=71010 RepID=UPI0034630546